MCCTASHPVLVSLSPFWRDCFYLYYKKAVFLALLNYASSLYFRQIVVLRHVPGGDLINFTIHGVLIDLDWSRKVLGRPRSIPVDYWHLCDEYECVYPSLGCSVCFPNAHEWVGIIFAYYLRLAKWRITIIVLWGLYIGVEINKIPHKFSKNKIYLKESELN